jgi:hypothetical protein
MDRMSAIDELVVMSPEAVAPQIAAMRAGRRAQPSQRVDIPSPEGSSEGFKNHNVHPGVSVL